MSDLPNHTAASTPSHSGDASGHHTSHTAMPAFINVGASPQRFTATDDDDDDGGDGDGDGDVTMQDPPFSFDKKTDLSACFDKFINKSLDAASTNNSWAPELLQECARAIHENDGPKVQYLMWVLNELSSPYGDCEQRLASAFLQALFAKLTGTGSRYYRSLCTAAAKSHSFHSMKKMVLKYQELSPWMTVGIVAANAVILEALDGEKKVHILDISNTFCTQWPTLFEALAMRADHPPHLRLTTVTQAKGATTPEVMKEITHRLQKFARLMGIPFEFKVLQQLEIEKLDPSMLELREDETLIINSIQSLQHSPESLLPSLFRSMNPKLITIVEDEVDLTSSDFMACFHEALEFYAMFFESLEDSFPRASNERLMLERVAARSIVGTLACDGTPEIKRQEKCSQWGTRMKQADFAPSSFSTEIFDDVQALLKRYKSGWALCRGDNGLFLTWKQQNAISVSAWKHV